MVVGKDDPQIGAQRLELSTNLGGRLFNPRDRASVLGFRHRKELRGMWQHRPANHA
jgi:hypothetical protein